MLFLNCDDPYPLLGSFSIPGKIRGTRKRRNLRRGIFKWLNYPKRAKNFKNRLNIHLKTKVKDKFHLFANLVVACAEINLNFL